MSFSKTHLDRFERILRDVNIISYPIDLEKGKPTVFEIYIIDMQNGFMSSGECGVLDSDHLPERIVTYLDYMNWYVEQLNKRGFIISLHFIFSRDYHHPHHHSFWSETNPNGFPPHCQYGTNSSMLHPKIIEWIKYNSDKNITITFKAYHPHIESYSAIPYTDHYDASHLQGTCCNSYDTIGRYGKLHSKLTSGGGVVFPDMSLDELLKPNPFNKDIDMILKDSASELINNNADITIKYILEHGKSLEMYNPYPDVSIISHSFVVGLAGDFCVRDTVINAINQKAIKNITGDTCLVYNLTSYVVLPTGTHESESPMTVDADYVDEPEEGTDYYIWVSNIRELILDYVENRMITLKPPVFIKFELDEPFMINYFGGRIGHL